MKRLNARFKQNVEEYNNINLPEQEKLEMIKMQVIQQMTLAAINISAIDVNIKKDVIDLNDNTFDIEAESYICNREEFLNILSKLKELKEKLEFQPALKDLIDEIAIVLLDNGRM